GGVAGHRHEEHEDWPVNRVGGLLVDVDRSAPSAAVEGDHVAAGAVDRRAEGAGRAGHHGPGDTALPPGGAVRKGVDWRAPGAAVERERVTPAVNGDAEAGRRA